MVGESNAENIPEDALPPVVKPTGIDFGSLKPGHGANATLKVTGGPAQVIVHTDRLKVMPASFGLEGSELQLTLLPGSAGELMWDDILLQGNAGEVKVLVTARWEESSASAPAPEAASVAETVPAKPPEGEGGHKLVPSGNELEKRTFKGKTCRWCGENIHYDTNSRSWTPCKTCRGACIPVGIILRLSREFYLGTKELRPVLTEIWDTLVGRDRRKG